MKTVCNFLNECGVFYISTVNGELPEVRPFGAIMEYDGLLYFSTANTKSVYSQINNNPNIQIVALKAGTREWIRVRGKAFETREIYIKQAMLDAFPIIKTRFDIDSSEYALFEITKMNAEINKGSGIIKIIVK